VWLSESQIVYIRFGIPPVASAELKKKRRVWGAPAPAAGLPKRSGELHYYPHFGKKEISKDSTIYAEGEARNTLSEI